MTLAVRLMILKRIKSMPKCYFHFTESQLLVYLVIQQLSPKMDPVYSCQSQEDFLVISHSLYANESCTLSSEHCSPYTNQRSNYLCCCYESNY
jgi:hypothetical protein